MIGLVACVGVCTWSRLDAVQVEFKVDEFYPWCKMLREDVGAGRRRGDRARYEMAFFQQF